MEEEEEEDEENSLSFKEQLFKRMAASSLKKLDSLPNLIQRGKLWISCLYGARKADQIPSLTAVIAIGPDKIFIESWYAKFKHLEYHYIEIDDSESADIFQHFDSATEFIHNQKGEVLVHCAQGMSRSASICIAYLIRYVGLNLEQAMAVCKIARPIVQPNAGFMEALKRYENKFFH
jgi:hypothetical protein